jgi:hypothetical protein
MKGFVFGNIFARIPDARLNGPYRTDAPCGPYWFAIFHDHRQLERKLTEEAALRVSKVNAELEAAKAKLQKHKTAETEKRKARNVRRAGSRPTATSQQNLPFASRQIFSFTTKQKFSSAPKEAFAFTPKQAFSSATKQPFSSDSNSAPMQGFSSALTAPTKVDFESAPRPPQGTSPFTLPRQSEFAFGSSPPPSGFTFGSSSAKDFEIPATWQENTDVPRSVPVMPKQGQHQR